MKFFGISILLFLSISAFAQQPPLSPEEQEKQMRKIRKTIEGIEAELASIEQQIAVYDEKFATATEYNEMRTNWMKALSDHIQARYDYLFRSKILEFYQGVPLEL